MNRTEWQRLAKARLRDAKVLLNGRRWSAAYYLAGYAVECGLKSCVLVRVTVTPEIALEDKRFSEKCWTHNLMQLIDQAGLKASLDSDIAADTELRSRFTTVQSMNGRPLQ